MCNDRVQPRALMAGPEFVAGVDGCPGGWVCFLVDVHSRATSIQVIDLSIWPRDRPPGLTCIGIDIPIGLLDCPRACDLAARKLLGARRDSSVFPTPCRASCRQQAMKRRAQSIYASRGGALAGRRGESHRKSGKSTTRLLRPASRGRLKFIPRFL